MNCLGRLKIFFLILGVATDSLRTCRNMHVDTHNHCTALLARETPNVRYVRYSGWRAYTIHVA